MLTFYALAYTGLLIVAGRLADTVGRGQVFNLGLGLFVLASLGVALASWVPIIVASHANPIVPRTLFFISTFRFASIAVFVFSLGFFSTFLTLVLFLTEVWTYSALSAGPGITAPPLAAAISANVRGE